MKTIYLLACLFISQCCQGQNLVFHLNFNNNTTDQTGNNVGTVFGNPVYAAGKAGQANTALRFDGVNDYLVFPPHSSLNFNSGFTIYAVIKPKDFYTGTCHGNMILSKGSVRDAGHYGLVMTDDNYNRANQIATCSAPFVNVTKETFEGTRNTYGTTYGNVNENTPPDYGYLTQNVNGLNTYLSAAPYIVKDDWYCVKYTFNKQTGISKLFVNEALVGTNTLHPNFVSNNNANLTIGRQIDPLYPTYIYQLNVVIDDIKIFDGPIETQNIEGDYPEVLACESPLGVNDKDQNQPSYFTVLYENAQVQLAYKLPNANSNGILNLYNLSGAMVQHYALNKAEGKLSLKETKLSPGMYIAKLNLGKEIEVIKILIK